MANFVDLVLLAPDGSGEPFSMVIPANAQVGDIIAFIDNVSPSIAKAGDGLLDGNDAEGTGVLTGAGVL